MINSITLSVEKNVELMYYFFAINMLTKFDNNVIIIL